MTRKVEAYAAMPIDFKILELLPDKGMIGGLHWRGRRVKDLLDQILTAEPELKEYIASSSIQARLRAMDHAGYVQNFKTVGGGGVRIWARTGEGIKFLETKDEVLGGG